METSQKVIAKIDRDFITHKFFNYLLECELLDIKDRLNKFVSLAVAFTKNDEILFCAVFDLDCESLHVREVCGNFGKNHNVLDIFSEGLAKALKKQTITFCTNSRAVEKWASAKGYVYIEGEFTRGLN